MTLPLISVVMPVYNERICDLNNSINSILNQNYKNFEYVIVDDNPKNIKIKNYLKRRALYDNRIKLIFNKKNFKLVKSENIGIRNSNGTYIARMDADDISRENRLVTQLISLEKNNLDLICSNCSLINDKNKIVKRHCFSNITQYKQKEIKHIMSYCNIANGPTLFFKKKVFNKIQGYRVPLIDDYDFVCRALVKKFRVGYQSRDLIMKRHRESSISNSNLLKQFNGVLVLSKFLRKTGFSKIISLNKLKDSFDKINKRDNDKYIKFLGYRDKFKSTHSIIDLCMAIAYIITTNIILKRTIWNKLVATRQSYLIK